MKANLATVQKLESSFLSCEKDFETILRKLFIENQPHSDELKRLLVINTSDTLDKSNSQYNQIVKSYDLAKLVEDRYVMFNSKLKMPEKEEVKSMIMISMDDFAPNRKNPQYRDCKLHFDIVTHMDYWDIGDYQVRPLKIAGYIDGILNKSKLSGIGELEFFSCQKLNCDYGFAGYNLIYKAIHGSEDRIPILD